MDIKSNLNKSFPALKNTETVQKGLETCLKESIENIFLLDSEGIYLGSISQEQLLDFDNDTILGDIDFEQIAPIVENSSVIDLFKIPFEIEFVALVNEQQKYIGAINKNQVIFKFLNNTTLAKTGAVLYLEMPAIDFSLGTIARLVEENNVKILGSFTETYIENDIERFKLILKLGQGNINGVIQTLERFNYNITAIFGLQKDHLEGNSNYDYMMKYLEM